MTEDIEFKIYNKFYKFALKRGMNRHECEDFRGWAYAKWKQRGTEISPWYEYLYIDYLRKSRGRNGREYSQQIRGIREPFRFDERQYINIESNNRYTDKDIAEVLERLC